MKTYHNSVGARKKHTGNPQGMLSKSSENMKFSKKIPRSIIWAKASDVCAISYIDQRKTLFIISCTCTSVALRQNLPKYLKTWIAPGHPYSPQGLKKSFQKWDSVRNTRNQPTENVMWKFYIKRIIIMLSNIHEVSVRHFSRYFIRRKALAARSSQSHDCIFNLNVLFISFVLSLTVNLKIFSA